MLPGALGCGGLGHSLRGTYTTKLATAQWKLRKLPWASPPQAMHRARVSAGSFPGIFARGLNPPGQGHERAISVLCTLCGPTGKPCTNSTPNQKLRWHCKGGGIIKSMRLRSDWAMWQTIQAGKDTSPLPAGGSGFLPLPAGAKLGSSLAQEDAASCSEPCSILRIFSFSCSLTSAKCGFWT
jgi:hypothetical protein